MADFQKLQCLHCLFGYCQIAFREQQDANGNVLLSDQRWCYRCSTVTERRYTPPSEIDPDLEAVLSGNTGRILRNLFEMGSLHFADWPLEAQLPSPRRIGNVSKPLVFRQLVQVTDEGVLLAEGVAERMERYYSRGECPLCATPYIYPQRCPNCGGDMNIIETGRCE